MASFSLSAMFGAVHEAIVHAAQDVEQSAWETLKERYFTESDDGSFTPKTIRIKLPHAENGKVTQAPVDVPLFSLSKHGSLVIDELNMKFDVDLRGLDKKEKHLVGSLPRKFLSRKATAKVEIRFKGAEASEGVMLINDKIHQTFPR